jgi:hypothetical protein
MGTSKAAAYRLAHRADGRASWGAVGTLPAYSQPTNASNWQHSAVERRLITVVVRLVGGPADELVFVVPQDNLPKFVGVGYPVSKYVPQPSNGEVRLFHYVALH